MSETIDIDLDYEVCFCREHLRTFLEALKSAVDDNWRGPVDEWSTPEPSGPILVDSWLAQLNPDRMTRREFDGQVYHTGEFLFSVSPVSCYLATLYVIDRHDHGLSALITVPRSIIAEVRGDRERLKMEQGRPGGPAGDAPDSDDWTERYDNLGDTEPVWPQVRTGLIHIHETLRASLPVRGGKLSEALG